MIKLCARKDWENYSADPDTGNYWEYIPLKRRLKYKIRDWIYVNKRVIKYRSLFEYRWYRLRWYRRNHKRNASSP